MASQSKFSAVLNPWSSNIYNKIIQSLQFSGLLNAIWYSFHANNDPESIHRLKGMFDDLSILFDGYSIQQWIHVCVYIYMYIIYIYNIYIYIHIIHIHIYTDIIYYVSHNYMLIWYETVLFSRHRHRHRVICRAVRTRQFASFAASSSFVWSASSRNHGDAGATRPCMADEIQDSSGYIRQVKIHQVRCSYSEVLQINLPWNLGSLLFVFFLWVWRRLHSESNVLPGADCKQDGLLEGKSKGTILGVIAI